MPYITDDKDILEELKKEKVSKEEIPAEVDFSDVEELVEEAKTAVMEGRLTKQQAIIKLIRDLRNLNANRVRDKRRKVFMGRYIGISEIPEEEVEE